MNKNIEIVDSSQMTVLSEFNYVDEVFDNTDHYKIGVLGKNVLIEVRNLNGKESAGFLYERDSHLDLIVKMEDVYAGKLNELDKDYFSFKNGKDFLVIGITSTFPHTSFKPITKFSLTNNRPAVLDNIKASGWFLYMLIETGKLMLKEMKKIKDQVIN
ncbi:MAG: hypothetical protein ACR2LT_00725 [Pyrinomonadaceae bacterium]